MKTHQQIDERSLAMTKAIVARIDADPDKTGLARAKATCQRWFRERPMPAIGEWLEILERPWDQIRTVLLDESETGRRLRQSDPFCGILTPQERWEIYGRTMKRTELEHIIRAAGSITNAREIVIIGSQAILASFPDAPPELTVSQEADTYPMEAPEKADLIDGSIGEKSPFHDTFGYYAHGVGPETAVLPARWKTRLVPVKNENTLGVTGLCLSPVDLAVSKLAAGREKDMAFVTAMLRHHMVTAEKIQTVLVEMTDGRLQTIRQRLNQCQTEAA